MSASRNVYQKLGNRVSEEVQLLAEEKWIVEAVAQIKNQCNCLQIERLHLESLKAKSKKDISDKVLDQSCNMSVSEDSLPSTSAVHMMQNVNVTHNKEEKEQDENFCNQEELNLMVSRNPLLVATLIDENTEEEEEDEDSEMDDDTFIDINMLMYASKD